LRHDLIRETIKTFKLTGLEIATISDIPGEGTGLGSSSAVTVGLLAALSRKFDRVTLSPSYLAEEAYAIEADKCKHPVGKQDQYAVAHGGMNFFYFNSNDTVLVQNITPLIQENKKRFEDHLLLLWTGRKRSANEILSEQGYNIGKNIDGVARRMHEMVEIATSMRSDMISNCYENIGNYLDLNWQLKKTMATRITDDEIDRLYQAGRDAGADGGKLCGAGGGGFLLFWASPHMHQDILDATGLRKVDIHIEEQGCKVIYEQP
jgi:D-glycero-alpha-D-manno-heptose-7-phosphate kinase